MKGRTGDFSYFINYEEIDVTLPSPTTGRTKIERGINKVNYLYSRLELLNYIEV